MMIPLSINKQTPQLLLLKTHATLLTKERANNNLSFHEKDKVAVILGPTGSGKSRLAIDLAVRFDGEIVNSDKMQVYRGLDVITNKIPDEERRGIPHHLMSFVDPEEDFDSKDFVRAALNATGLIARKGKLPIIAGGSNSFVEALVSKDDMFRSKYECCVFRINMRMSVLDSFVSERVDDMVGRGLVEEARGFFDLEGDYALGIRRSIGVLELHEFFENEGVVDGEIKEEMLRSAIDRIKENTRALTHRQVEKILRLEAKLECGVHRVDPSEALGRGGGAWERAVVEPCVRVLDQFLRGRVGFGQIVAAM